MVIDANPRRFREATFAVTGAMLPLLGLSPVSGEPVVAKFDGGLLSSGRRIMVLREVEQRLGVADRIAANGDACNKISAYLKALAARDCGLPFYVAAPNSTSLWPRAR